MYSFFKCRTTISKMNEKFQNLSSKNAARMCKLSQISNLRIWKFFWQSDKTKAFWKILTKIATLIEKLHIMSKTPTFPSNILYLCNRTIKYRKKSLLNDTSQEITSHGKYLMGTLVCFSFLSATSVEDTSLWFLKHKYCERVYQKF